MKRGIPTLHNIETTIKIQINGEHTQEIVIALSASLLENSIFLEIQTNLIPPNHLDLYLTKSMKPNGLCSYI